MNPKIEHGMKRVLELSREWKEEISRRCRQIDEDEVQLIPGDSVFTEAAKLIT
jgi:hypothetical protein